MVHDKTKWIMTAARIVGATAAIVLLTVRAVYGAESTPLPDGLTGPAIIASALLYMAKTIYELVTRHKIGEEQSTNPKLNDAAWQILTSHMEREEELFKQLTYAQDRTAAALTQLTIQISK
jgi:hypothetical protein